MNAIPKPQHLQPQIADQERVKRTAAINFARGSVRFEGIVLPPEIEEINQNFIDGEINIDQFVKAVEAFASHG
ncbi:hypothetical protein FACS1894154_07930 [Betaproteobacteria bacterium]|nr:hypothetical protein FACS1894154_07930 [Betaproteobacteria bacterium]